MRLKRIQVDLGVQICGGNLYGIFVESLDDDSPAKSPDGLLPGDLILEVFISGFISDCHVCNENDSELHRDGLKAMQEQASVCFFLHKLIHPQHIKAATISPTSVDSVTRSY